MTDVEDDDEDVVVVPAGFIEVAENLGLLSTPAASGPREKLEEPHSAPHVQPDEKPPTIEHPCTEIETPSSSRAATQATSLAPSPFPSLSPSSSTQPSYMVPASVVVEAICNDSQNTAATSSPTYLESSEPSAPFSVPQAASVPELFQETAGSSASQHQTSTFCDNNINNTETFHFHGQDIQIGSTGDDINMQFLDATMEPPVRPLPATWTTPQPQSEHQSFYSHVSQVAYNNDNNNRRYTMNGIYPNWTSMASIPIFCCPVNKPY